MPLMNNRGIGSIGMITDTPPHEIPPNAWTLATNVRFVNNKAKKMGGIILAFDKGMPDTVPLALIPFDEDSWLYATNDSIYQATGSNHTDITRVGSDGTTKVPYTVNQETKWTYTRLSNSVVFNVESDIPQGKVPTDSKFKNLVDWDENWRTHVIRSYKNFLIGLNMTEGPINLPQRVRWSGAAEPNNLPKEWKVKTTNLAGYNDLTGASSDIVDGLPLRDQFIIYTEDEVFSMQFVGGNTVFAFRKLFGDAGMLSRNCVAEFDGNHLVVGKSDIYVHNGSTKKSIVTGRIKDFLLNEITKVNYKNTKVITYTPAKEVWICYPGPDSIQGEQTKAAVYNWEGDTWTFISLPRTWDINIGPQPPEDARSWETTKGSWGENINTWSGIGIDFKSNILLVASQLKKLYIVDQGVTVPASASFQSNHIWKGDISGTIDKTTTGDFSLDFHDVDFYTLGDYHTITVQQTVDSTIKANLIGLKGLALTANEDKLSFDIVKFIDDHTFVIRIIEGDPSLTYTKVLLFRGSIQYGTGNDVSVNSWLERSYLDLDEMGADIVGYKWIRTIYPQFSGSGDVMFQVGGSHVPQGPVRWSNPRKFRIGKDYKVDVRTKYRYLSIRVFSVTPGEWSFTGYDFDVVAGGRR